MAYQWDNAVSPLYLPCSHSPGPELRENDKSTDPFVMDCDLKRDIQARASVVSSGDDREATWGAVGRASLLV